MNYNRVEFLIIILISFMISGCGQPTTADETPAPAREVAAFTFTPTPIQISPTVAVSQTPAPPAPSSTPEPRIQLTFLRDRPCESCLYGIASDLYAIDVYCMQLDNDCFGEPSLLFQWEEWVADYDWSPDGRQIAFESQGNIFIADWNGENASLIPVTFGSEGFPRWSLDGNRLAFIYLAGREGSEALDPAKILSLEVATSQIVPLFEFAINPSRVDWLPDGKMAFSAEESIETRQTAINIMNPDGNIIHQLPQNWEDYSSILDWEFSSSLEHLAFVGELKADPPFSNLDIYIHELESGITINLTKGVGRNLDPAWAPNGNLIAFGSKRSDIWNVYLYDVSSEMFWHFSSEIYDENNPTWRIIR